MVHVSPLGGGDCQRGSMARGTPRVCSIAPLADVAGPAGRLSQVAQGFRNAGDIRLAVLMPWRVSFAV